MENTENLVIIPREHFGEAFTQDAPTKSQACYFLHVEPIADQPIPDEYLVLRKEGRGRTTKLSRVQLACIEAKKKLKMVDLSDLKTPFECFNRVMEASSHIQADVVQRASLFIKAASICKFKLSGDELSQAKKDTLAYDCIRSTAVFLSDSVVKEGKERKEEKEVVKKSLEKFNEYFTEFIETLFAFKWVDLNYPGRLTVLKSQYLVADPSGSSYSLLEAVMWSSLKPLKLINYLLCNRGADNQRIYHFMRFNYHYYDDKYGSLISESMLERCWNYRFILDGETTRKQGRAGTGPTSVDLTLRSLNLKNLAGNTNKQRDESFPFDSLLSNEKYSLPAGWHEWDLAYTPLYGYLPGDDTTLRKFSNLLRGPPAPDSSALFSFYLQSDGSEVPFRMVNLKFEKRKYEELKEKEPEVYDPRVHGMIPKVEVVPFPSRLWTPSDFSQPLSSATLQSASTTSVNRAYTTATQLPATPTTPVSKKQRTSKSNNHANFAEFLEGNPGIDYESTSSGSSESSDKQKRNGVASPTISVAGISRESSSGTLSNAETDESEKWDPFPLNLSREDWLKNFPFLRYPADIRRLNALLSNWKRNWRKSECMVRESATVGYSNDIAVILHHDSFASLLHIATGMMIGTKLFEDSRPPITRMVDYFKETLKISVAQDIKAGVSSLAKASTRNYPLLQLVVCVKIVMHARTSKVMKPTDLDNIRGQVNNDPNFVFHLKEFVQYVNSVLINDSCTSFIDPSLLSKMRQVTSKILECYGKWKSTQKVAMKFNDLLQLFAEDTLAQQQALDLGRRPGMIGLWIACFNASSFYVNNESDAKKNTFIVYSNYIHKDNHISEILKKETNDDKKTDYVVYCGSTWTDPNVAAQGETSSRATFAEHLFVQRSPVTVYHNNGNFAQYSLMHSEDLVSRCLKMEMGLLQICNELQNQFKDDSFFKALLEHMETYMRPNIILENFYTTSTVEHVREAFLQRGFKVPWYNYDSFSLNEYHYRMTAVSSLFDTVFIFDKTYIHSNKGIPIDNIKIAKEFYQNDDSVCMCVGECGNNCWNKALGVECHPIFVDSFDVTHPSNCIFGADPNHCNNCKVTNMTLDDLNKLVKVSRSEKKGNILLAVRDFKVGELVMNYVGELCDKEMADERIEASTADGLKQSMYLMKLTPNYFLDAKFIGNNTRYISHSCDPNCITKKCVIRGIAAVVIVNIRDIKAGEEITYSYFSSQITQGPEKGFICDCGSVNCVDKDQIPICSPVSDIDDGTLEFFNSPKSQTRVLNEPNVENEAVANNDASSVSFLSDDIYGFSRVEDKIVSLGSRLATPFEVEESVVFSQAQEIPTQRDESVNRTFASKLDIKTTNVLSEATIIFDKYAGEWQWKETGETVVAYVGSKKRQHLQCSGDAEFSD